MRFSLILSVIVLVVGGGLFIISNGDTLNNAPSSPTSTEEVTSQSPPATSLNSSSNLPTANNHSGVVLTGKGDSFSRFRAQREQNTDRDDSIFTPPQPDTTVKNSEFNAHQGSVDESVSYLKSLVESVDEAGLSIPDSDIIEIIPEDRQTAPLHAIKNNPLSSPSSSKPTPTPDISPTKPTTKNNITHHMTPARSNNTTPQKESNPLNQKKYQPISSNNDTKATQQAPLLMPNTLALLTPETSPSEPQSPTKKTQSRKYYSVAIIIHKDNFDNLTKRDIKNIYTDKMNTWKNGEKILVFNLPLNTAEREKFSSRILDMSSLEAATAESNRVITNSARNSYQTKRNRLVTSYVSRQTNAIGYVPFDEVKDDERVKIIYKIR